MCGIIGIINFDKKRVEQKTLRKMNNALIHRGPDDEGFFVDSNVGLGHRRLSIIDLTEAGHQPMFSQDKSLVIVYNGEIYNYLELKEELVDKGHKFTTKTDTEVILASYKEWGTDCQKKFNGMWAFALYDKNKNLIFISRDRLGVKPLYYYADKEKFIIASEIKGILANPQVKASANDKIIWDYLVTKYVNHTTETFFQGIKELRGGHYLMIRDGKLRIQKYWDLKNEILNGKQDDNIERFKDLFEDSVKLRLRSDVPIGTCLSGGLDSSAIVCQVNNILKTEKVKQVGDLQKTFSAVYGANYKECDEKKYIDIVTQKTKVKPYFIYPSAKKIKTEIKKLIWHQDEPFVTTSIYAQWNVFRLAKEKKVKVMLDGQGADELLAGYTGYFGLYFQELLKSFKIGSLISEVIYFSKKHPPAFLSLWDIFKNGLQAGWLGGTLTNLFHKVNPVYNIFDKEFLKSKETPKRFSFSTDSFQNALYNSLMMNLSSLLRYEDRNSMTFSIESRVPFLDYRLVELIFSLPANYKIRQGETKWVMRKAFEELLPAKIRNRQDKIGFATPEAEWFKKDLKEEFINCFSSESFAKRKYWQSARVLDLFNKFLQGEFHDSQIFWRLYNLEIWFRVFIDKNGQL